MTAYTLSYARAFPPQLSSQIASRPTVCALRMNTAMTVRASARPVVAAAPSRPAFRAPRAVVRPRLFARAGPPTVRTLPGNVRPWTHPILGLGLWRRGACPQKEHESRKAPHPASLLVSGCLRREHHRPLQASLDCSMLRLCSSTPNPPPRLGQARSSLLSTRSG